MEAETIIYNLYSSAAEMKHRTPNAFAGWVPKVLIGERSAKPGSDERKCLGEDGLLWEHCKLKESIITFS